MGVTIAFLMALVIGTATVSADAQGNITIGGSDMALALAQSLAPTLSPAAILAIKAVYPDNTSFQNALNAIYVTNAIQLATALAPYINTNI
jgi:hypothetical protein